MVEERTEVLYGPENTIRRTLEDFHLFGNLGRMNSFRHGLDRKIIITFGIPSILLSLLGASPVGIISQDTFKVILGVFLILISVSFLVKPKLKFPTNLWTVIFR
jgi:uncharacterized protein